MVSPIFWPVTAAMNYSEVIPDTRMIASFSGIRRFLPLFDVG
jgi:hypothetical protein